MSSSPSNTTPTSSISFSSVKECGVCADQNWQHRRKMEDAHFIKDNFCAEPTTGFFSIFDGHGGKEAATFSANNLHQVRK